MFLWLFLVILSIFLYFKLIKPCGYWKGRGIQCENAYPIIGSMGKVVLKKKPYADVAVDLYNKHPNEKFVGYMQFMRRSLLLRDLDLIKRITTKDFNFFTDYSFFGQCEADSLLNKSLVSLNGQKWKDLRATLNPVFQFKMRNTYSLIRDCAKNFVDHIEEQEFEMRTFFSKYAGDVIASLAFGEDTVTDPRFYQMGTKLTEFSFWQNVKLNLVQYLPALARIFRIQVFPRSATKYFRQLIQDGVQKRQDGVIRQDLIHLLLETRKKRVLEAEKVTKREGFAIPQDSEVDPTAKEVELTDDHILAQAMIFFLSGFDTISTTCSFMAYEIAIHPQVQERLQEEIGKVLQRYGTEVSYEVLTSMKYLDQVVSETLRLWPAAFETDRLCTRDYLIKAETSEEKDFLVKKGITVVIPIMAIHRDSKYFPEADRFDPDRFSDENKSKVCNYFPFGLGPRNCIGSRLALLEIKSAFFHLLSKFEIVPVDRTDVPLKISPRCFYLQAEKGLWLGLKPRHQKI